MRTPRFGRLGLVSAGACLALVSTVLGAATAAGPGSPSSIELTKTWSTASPVDSGATVVATITAQNTDLVNAVNDVTVTDVYDPGLTFVSAVASGGGTCTDDPTDGFRRVDCELASIGANNFETVTITFTAHYWGYRTYTRNYRTEERLEIQKAETHVDILSGQTRSATVTCPSGFDILDFSWHLQQVDQDTGDFYDVHRMSSTVADDSATVTLFNDAAGKAQGKLWAICLKDETNLGNPVDWEPRYSDTMPDVAPDGPDERPFHAECPLGYTPMAVNVSAVPGASADLDAVYMDDVLVQTGLESDGGRRSTIWAVVKDHADITLQWRCLKTSIGVNRLWFQNVEDSVAAVPAHDKVAQKQINCDHHHKGVVGGWRGGHFNGSEPRPRSRVHWLWHDGPGTYDFEGSLLCLHTRLFRGGKVKKDGTVSDVLHNHARGTSGNGGEHVDAVEPTTDLVVKQTS